MPTAILIGQQNSSGAFTAIAELSFQASNTKLRVIDLHEQTTDFVISDTELLCFAVSVTSGEGGGQNYFITPAEALTDETASFEIKEDVALGIVLEEKQSPSGLMLDFIGDGDQDALRVRTRCNNEVEFGLQRTTGSVILKVFVPEEE
ncbi:MAG: hypothetical protein H6557_23365 [Lewinellaceae bacterium]|nr:hypothetical protein [Phaeodactylibacter sp.]MCB9039567.1 hypothetical protein [Lewinellaceae bacterium]